MEEPVHLRPATLDSPAEYACHVWDYSPSLSRLLLRLTRGDFLEGETRFVIFSTVRYYSGPMAWKSAEFTFGSLEEISQLFNQIWSEGHPRHGDSDPIDLAPPQLFLFADTARILCYSASLYDQDPGPL